MKTRTAALNNIINKCEKFIKLSGMLEAPPVMLEDLYKKLTFVYSSAVLYYLDYLPEKTEKEKILQKEVTKFSNKELSLDNDLILNIPINLTNWKHYNKRFENVISELPDTLNIKFTKYPLKNNNQGVFDPETYTIIVHVYNININDLSIFRLSLANMKETVRHELQHYSQLLLYYLVYLLGNNPKTILGLPPKAVQNIKVKDEDLEHPLQDVEFYTNLQDSIDSFKEKVKTVHPVYRKLFAKAWVGASTELFDTLSAQIENSNISDNLKKIKIEELYFFTIAQPPFNVLKEKSINKWKVAVKHFMIQVADLL